MNAGFSLIELLIALVIIAILSSIAIPTYQQYTKRAYFSEIIMAAEPLKLSVTNCFIQTGTLTECNNNENGIPDSESGQSIKTAEINEGVITLTPLAQHGLEEEDTYTLTPTVIGDTLSWAASGGAADKGLV